MRIDSTQAFNTGLQNLGSDSQRLAALAEYAVSQVQEHDNLDAPMRLLARLNVIKHDNTEPVDSKHLPKTARFVKGYLGEQARLTIKQGGLVKKGGEYPAYESFNDYVARMSENSGSGNSNPYNGLDKLQKEVKALEKKRDEAYNNGDSLAGAAFDRVRAELQSQVDEYQRQIELAVQNAKRAAVNAQSETAEVAS